MSQKIVQFRINQINYGPDFFSGYAVEMWMFCSDPRLVDLDRVIYFKKGFSTEEEMNLFLKEFEEEKKEDLKSKGEK